MVVSCWDKGIEHLDLDTFSHLEERDLERKYLAYHSPEKSNTNVTFLAVGPL